MPSVDTPPWSALQAGRLVAGEAGGVGQPPAEIEIHELGAVLTHDAPAQSAVVLPAGNVETPGTGGAELDQVLVYPGHDVPLVVSPLASLARHVLQQPVQADYQSVGLRGEAVHSRASNFLKLGKMTLTGQTGRVQRLIDIPAYSRDWMTVVILTWCKF